MTSDAGKYLRLIGGGVVAILYLNFGASYVLNILGPWTRASFPVYDASFIGYFANLGVAAVIVAAVYFGARGKGSPVIPVATARVASVPIGGASPPDPEPAPVLVAVSALSVDPSKYSVEKASELFEKMMTPKEVAAEVHNIAKQEGLSDDGEALLRALGTCIEQRLIKVKTVKRLVPKGKATIILKGLDVEEITTLEAVDDEEPEQAKPDEKKETAPDEMVPIKEDV